MVVYKAGNYNVIKNVVTEINMNTKARMSIVTYELYLRLPEDKMSQHIATYSHADMAARQCLIKAMEDFQHGRF